MASGDFGPLADAYARARPGYPPTILDLLVEHVGLRPGDRVTEIGAGTGLFTRLLAERGFDVIALEPSTVMRSRAPALPRVTWGSGTFEDTGLPSHSQRWVVAAQSFHWAHPEAALHEIRRVLEPGGWLTALWNTMLPEREPLVAWTLAAVRRHIPGYRFPGHGTTVRRAAARVISSFPRAGQRMVNTAVCILVGRRGVTNAGLLLATRDFGGAVYHEVEHRVSMSHERYLDLWRTYRRIGSVGRPGAFDAFVGDLSAHLARLGVNRVEVPYLCGAWSARAR